MPDPQNTSPEKDDPPHLDPCPECGYSLHGLREQGQCPECGLPYGPDRIVLYGWATGHKATWANRNWQGMSPGCIVQLVVMLLLLLAGFIPILLVVAVGAVRATILRRRFQRLGPRPVQVRLFPEGFGQRDGTGPVTLTPWSAEHRVRIEIVDRPSRLCRLRILSKRWMGMPLWHRDYVDIEFPCSVRTLENLRRQCAGWEVPASSQ